MKWVQDSTGRFEQRPHFEPGELDAECEAVISGFLVRKHGAIDYPIRSDDLAILLESLAADVDVYADLASEGEGVEGVTYFDPRGGKPRVRIASYLAEDPRRQNRYRTTLAHELGHVVLHSFIWKLDPARVSKASLSAASPRCRRDGMLSAPARDWMEWQAAYASGAFLMPRSGLDELMETLHPGRGSEPIPDRGGPANELVKEVERRFRVSTEAATVRLLQTGHLGASTRVISVSKQPGWYRRVGRVRAGRGKFG
jgi:hypothetical protein